MPVEKVCVVCGKGFSVPPCRAKTATTCSEVCAIVVRAKSRERKVTRKCLNCGKDFKIPRSHIDRRIYCSQACKYGSTEWKGNIGDRGRGAGNAMWKGGEPRQTDGYPLKKVYDHPFSWGGYILKHRLTMEEWLREEMPNSEYLIPFGNSFYLSPDAVVHHLDFDKQNGRRRNLLVCRKGTHSAIHFGVYPKPGTYWPPDAKIRLGVRPGTLAGPLPDPAERKARCLMGSA